MRPARQRGAAQRGQALVFVTIVMLAVLLALLTMYSMGQLTTEKMKLQNTADAAAYSSAVAQARDYNFAAYTNRAMIANQVAMAQMVGLTSWARNYDATFNTMASQIPTFPFGVVGDIMWEVPLNILKPVSEAFKSGIDAGAPIISTGLAVIIDALGTAQLVYHYGTAFTVAQTLGVVPRLGAMLTNLGFPSFDGMTDFLSPQSFNVINRNDPDASLSLLGLIGFAYNTYQWLGFTQNKDPTIAKGGAGANDGSNSERFAKVTTSSMDGFYDKRTLPWVPFPWPLPSVLVDPTYIVGSPMVYWFTMLLFHNGGTELRNNNKTWSAMDVTSFFGLLTIPIYIPPFGPFLNLPILPWLIPPFGSGAGGAAQEGPSSPINASNNFNRDDPASYKPYADAYGSSFSANAIIANMQAGKGAGSALANLPISGGGLRKYFDVKDIAQATDSEHQNNSSPAIIVEIEKPSNKVATAATGNLRIGRGTSADATNFCGLTSVARYAPTVTTTFDTGNFDVGDGTASNCMRALSKAEAYFSRPSDLFARDDSKTEYGSLYSPYWQARLLPNSVIEQGASLFFQGLNFASVKSAWEGSTFESWVK